jgi:hypothetical protein
VDRWATALENLVEEVRPHDYTAWEAYIQWYTPRTQACVIYVPPQPAASVPDATRVLASTAYPIRRDQHYDTAVSLKIHHLSLMVLYILQFLLIISFPVRCDCGPFTYCRGLDGEAGPDVTPGDRGDIPQDGCHHQEVPCRGELSRKPGSTTFSTVPPVVLHLRLDWSFPRGTVVLVTATLPAAFYPARPPVHPPFRMSPLGGAPLRGPAYTCTHTRKARTGTTRTRTCTNTGSFLAPRRCFSPRY